MTVNTPEGALGLRDRLAAEIETLLGRGVRTSADMERVVGLRAQLKQVETLVEALVDSVPASE